jgi:flagellar FliL protein
VANKPETVEVGNAPAKSKKMLFIIVGVVLFLAAGGAFFVISKQRAAENEDEGAPAKVAHSAPKTPPVYLPLDNMVVNLADPGGDKVAQVGITLEVVDAKASDSVKMYLPSIRSGILLLVSQRTSEELLTHEGKEKLAKDILRQAAIPFGGDEEEEEEAPKKKKSKKKVVRSEYPVVGVLFSSFIIQ